MVPHIRFACVTALMLTLSLGGCSLFEHQAQVRGDRIDADQMKELTIGTSTERDVLALVGSPTIRATFDDKTWIYISEVTRPRIGGTQAVEDQHVVTLTFDDKGVLRDIKTKGQDDSIPVTMVDRTTPSPGSEASFLQQLFGNIGRFNAGAVSTGAGPTGGAPKPF